VKGEGRNVNIMFKVFCYAALLSALLFVCPSTAPCGDEPFTGPSNWGSTGLMETPTARVLGERNFRLGYSVINPYRYYYGSLSPTRGLEISGRITEIKGVPGFAGDSAYGNYKDKAVDLKYQILPEGKFQPAFALGIMDPHGTRLYSSQYIALSKQIFPFDFTMGLGNGRFGKRPLPSSGDSFRFEMLSDTKTWLKDSQLFWGVHFAPSEKYALMIEYSPIKYNEQTSDPAQPKYFTKPVSSPYNFGVRWRPNQCYELDASYQRGDTIGVNFSMPFEIGRPIIPMYDPIYTEEPGPLPLEVRILKALTSQGFSNVGISSVGDMLVIDLQNGKFFYNTRALAVVFRTIAPMLPDSINKVEIIFKERDVPMFAFTTGRADMVAFAADRMSVEDILSISSLNTDITRVPQGEKYLRYSFAYGYKPQFQLFLNDPSGFWKGKLGLSVFATYPTWSGGSFTAGASFYPFASISTVNEPLSIPVRSDITDYISKKLLLDTLMFEQTNRLTEKIFTRFSMGILETEYDGLDWEEASPFFGGRLLLGLSGSVVKKRSVDNPLWVKSNDAMDYYKTAFFNTRINFPESDVSVDIKYGRFLAGDVGERVTISKFIKGVTLSAWYSRTDTSVFAPSDTSNRGYHDKGISVLIPMRLFIGTDSRSAYAQTLSPWTRDQAQDISHFNPLFDFLGRNTKVFLDKDREQMR